MIRALICAALLMATPAIAADESDRYATLPGWNIVRNDGKCIMYGYFDRGTTLVVDYNQTLNNAVVIVADDVLASVEDGKEYRLKLIFVSPHAYDDGWGIVKTTGTVLEDGGKGLTLKLNGTDFLNDLARYSTFALMRDDVIVESLSLKGTALAVAKLRACANEEAIAHPSDPLAGM